METVDGGCMGATEAETENCPECFNNMHSYRMNAESVPSSSGTGPAWGGGGTIEFNP